jgi:hypothetical protein
MNSYFLAPSTPSNVGLAPTRNRNTTNSVLPIRKRQSSKMAIIDKRYYRQVVPRHNSNRIRFRPCYTRRSSQPQLHTQTLFLKQAFRLLAIQLRYIWNKNMRIILPSHVNNMGSLISSFGRRDKRQSFRTQIMPRNIETNLLSRLP